MLAIINRYSHGLVVIPVAWSFAQNGVFELIENKSPIKLDELLRHTKANPGHLQVALKIFQSLKWLSKNENNEYFFEKKANAYKKIPQDIIELTQLPIANYLNNEFLVKWIELSCNDWNISDSFLKDLLDGVLLIPLVHALKSNNMLNNDHFDTLGYDLASDIAKLFLKHGWIDEKNFSFTPKGLFIKDHIGITGVTASYRPMLSCINDLIFGDSKAVFTRDESGYETHIDRTLNVVSSGFQHEKFFADIDNIIFNIFKRLPYEEQPKYIADMGCGDGSLLKRVYNIILNKTDRGSCLDKYPVYMIGIDYNEQALKETEITLKDIPHYTIHGNILDPEKLIDNLKHKIGIKDPNNILHLRSFLDHDRPFVYPSNITQTNDRLNIAYQGVYVDNNGQAILPAVAIQSLVEHFKKWSKIVNQHGLIILECHCVGGDTTIEFLDNSENLHFDSCHSFSMQHLVEPDVFLMCAAENGLFPIKDFFKKYPRTFPFSRITLNWFEKRPYIIRHPVPDDLQNLMDLEKLCWPDLLQTSQQEIFNRITKYPYGHCVVEAFGKIIGVIYSQRIDDISLLDNMVAEKAFELHKDNGPVVHFLAINVHPDFQCMELGHQLLDFMLLFSRLKSGVKRVVAITRCSNHISYSHINMEDYVNAKDHMGKPLDPILKFHKSHGANIIKPIAYRPQDYENDGKGVLIEFPQNGEKRPKSKQIEKQNIACHDFSHQEIESKVKQSIISLKDNIDILDITTPLMELGFDSLDLMELKGLFERDFNKKLDSDFFFKYCTPQNITSYFSGKENIFKPFVPQNVALNLLCEDASTNKGLTKNYAHSEDDIAIIGMSCRFPYGSDTSEAYWSILEKGIDAITQVPKSRWDIDKYFDPDSEKPGKIVTRYGGFLDNIDKFDAQFFKISPREANFIDPQHRLLLEVVWESIENSGYDPCLLKGSQTGIFIGIFSHDYELLQIKKNNLKNFHTYFETGSATSMASGRIAYVLGLEGPAMSVDTACSSSLVAIHKACQSLYLNDCDLAIAGGVNLLLSPELSISFSRSGMLSSSGRCKTFDSTADGYVRSEGCGIVVLKPLSKAVADNDNILAVIKGSAVNQDGASNGLTAPNGFAQERLLKKALENAKLSSNQISYIEAHGTGTSLGDPVEVKALETVFAKSRSKDNPLFIGSVKTNIGHTEGAAGIAGIIKTVLALQKGYIPQNLHFDKINPLINLEIIPAVIPTRKIKWDNNIRIAGVSSFGFSGTNAHIILQQAPVLNQVDISLKPTHYLFTLSAHDEKALKELVEKYISYIELNKKIHISDICFTACAGRTHFSKRFACVTDSVENLYEQLKQFPEIEPDDHRSKKEIVFLFTGQGSQYPGMGQKLYETQPIFRKNIDLCDSILKPIIKTSLLELFYPQSSDNCNLLHETAFTQPALFAFEYALAKMWQSWGIEPCAVVGHSVGEYVAACFAGVFSLEHALKLIAHRGRLMQTLPKNGKMLAIFSFKEEIDKLIDPFSCDVSIAAFNGPKLVVISGLDVAIDEIEKICSDKGLKSVFLTVSHAFHSPLMDPILDKFYDIANQIDYFKPQIPFISNVTGDFVKDEICNAKYWKNHIRLPVEFAKGMESLYLKGYKSFLEIGPKPVLLGMARQCLPEGAHGQEWTWLPSIRQERPEWQQICQTLQILYLSDFNINFQNVYSCDKIALYKRLPLPSYPFQRKKYWIETEKKETGFDIEFEDKLDAIIQLRQSGEFSKDEIALIPRILDVLTKHRNARLELESVKKWFYQIEWQTKAIKKHNNQSKPEKAIETPGVWLIFADKQGVGQKVSQFLESNNQKAIMVFPDQSYNVYEDGSWGIRAEVIEDYERLLQESLGIYLLLLKGIIHMWSLDIDMDENAQFSYDYNKLNCASGLCLVQTFSKIRESVLPKLCFITKGMMPVENDSPNVFQSALWGLGRTIALEHPEFWAGMVDLPVELLPEDIELLNKEIWPFDTRDKECSAIRNGKRYVARLVPKGDDFIKSEILDKPIFKSDKTYLITGGLGALGLQTAKWMAEKGARYIVLTGRSGASSLQAINTIAKLKEIGVYINVIKANVSKYNDTVKVFDTIKSSMPNIGGIIHAAGILHDGVLIRQSWDAFKKVMDPKVKGAWNIHLITQKMTDIDFFICFSSIISLIGMPGQGNYAAANSFMDFLMLYRNSKGLPGLSINWGPWSDSGMAAKTLEKNKLRMTGWGLETIDATKGLQLLERLPSYVSGHIGVFPIDWEKWSDNFGKDISLLDDLIHSKDIADSKKPYLLLNKLKDIPEEQAQDLLIDIIKQELCHILEMETVHLNDITKGFADLGMDSLMAIEMKNRLQKGFGAFLPSTLAFDYPNIKELTSYISSQVLGWDQQAEHIETVDQDSPIRDSILDEMEGFSEDEFEASLEEELAKLDKLLKDD